MPWIRSGGVWEAVPDLQRALAQLAEHRSPKPKVGGSSPSCPARRKSKRRNRKRKKEVVTDTPSARSARSERTSPVTFYRQVVAELRTVVWPSQQQLVTYFIVVMAFVLVMIA